MLTASKTVVPALAVLAASKTYGAVRALSDVTLTVLPGEVHGLIGQNGAGKSTLVGVASGAIEPDHGDVFIDGQPAIGDPRRARHLGLAIVRQEPALMSDLTVAENLFLGVSEALRPAPRPASEASAAPPSAASPTIVTPDAPPPPEAQAPAIVVPPEPGPRKA